MPGRFPSVTVLEHPGVGLAPWNARRSRLARRGGEVLVDGWPVVLYHFQSLHLRRASAGARCVSWCGNDIGPLSGVVPPVRLVLSRQRRLGRAEVELLWQAYRRELSAAARDLEALEPGWAASLTRDPPRELIADTSWDARWRAYRLFGRILPGPVRVAASKARARLSARATAGGLGAGE